MAEKTRFYHTGMHGLVTGLPEFTELRWQHITFSTTSQSSDGYLPTMVAKAMSEYGWLHLDIENASWVNAKYKAAPYNQPGGATLDDLEYERIRQCVAAKAINANIMIGTYWSQNELAVDGAFDTERFARQGTGLDPFGNIPGLINAVDFIDLGQYQGTVSQSWAGYLVSATRAQSLMPYWADVPRVFILQNTNFYKAAETDFQPYELLLQKIEWFQDNLSPPAAGFSFATFQDAFTYDVNDPYARIVRDLAIVDLPEAVPNTYDEDLLEARDQMAANLVATTASTKPQTMIDTAGVNWPGLLGQPRIPGVPL